MLAAATAVESLSFMSESQTSQIGSYAFSGIKSVTSAELSEEIEYIGNNAMERMYGLTDIYATKLKSVPELGENVWASTLQKNISLLHYGRYGRFLSANAVTMEPIQHSKFRRIRHWAA